MWTAWLLLTALGLDNAAVASSVPGPPRLAGRVTAPLLATACALAVVGAIGGRLVRDWIGPWAQLIGAMLLLALMVDALRTRHGSRLDAPPLDGTKFRRCLQAYMVHLDDLGVGFAAGALPSLALPWWGAACVLQAAGAGAAGLGLRAWLQEGRRLAAWSAMTLGVGAFTALAAIPTRLPAH